jgi:ribosomal protein S18 acetylase RimI-like enzyme
VGWTRERASGDVGASEVSLMELQIQPDLHGQGLETFLVGEALRNMLGSGATEVEVQIAETNQAGTALFRKLGFQQVDRGWVLRKGR